jgi:hypothetical protein
MKSLATLHVLIPNVKKSLRLGGVNVNSLGGNRIVI